mmetsp:Transcript_1579/g.5169  ORF Transcript_1579/g.5169 Transcript_1579/m.5169 type:complete len:211 (-) Transcript_1579:785-1417(-)
MSPVNSPVFRDRLEAVRGEPRGEPPLEMKDDILDPAREDAGELAGETDSDRTSKSSSVSPTPLLSSPRAGPRVGLLGWRFVLGLSSPASDCCRTFSCMHISPFFFQVEGSSEIGGKRASCRWACPFTAECGCSVSNCLACHSSMPMSQIASRCASSVAATRRGTFVSMITTPWVPSVLMVGWTRTNCPALLSARYLGIEIRLSPKSKTAS